MFDNQRERDDEWVPSTGGELDELPNSIQAEKSVVSSCLQHERLYREARGEGIDSDCFYHPSTKALYEVCETAPRDGNGEVDMIWLVARLKDNGHLDRLGGPSQVTDIYGYAIMPHGWSNWLDILREMKARRMAIRASQRISEALDSSEAIQHTKDALDALQKAVTRSGRAKDNKTAIQEFIDKFKQDREAGDLPGHSTGIYMLDAICGGMRNGSLWVVGGQTSRGKTVLMLQIAAEFIKKGKKVAMFSLEMEANELVGRLVTVVGKVDYGSINQPKNITKGELNQMARAFETLNDGQYWIDDSANQTIEGIAAESERIKDSTGELDLIVVDYLQLISLTSAKDMNRERQIAQLSQNLKQLAKAMKCPVLTASQLNEEGKTRESRAIAQDADALLYIVDDGVKIGKLRNGKRDDVLPLFLDGPMQVFKEVRQ